jgi:hypothetical protein
MQEPKKKRRSSLAKVTSLAAILSPVAPVKKVGNTLQVFLALQNHCIMRFIFVVFHFIRTVNFCALEYSSLEAS